MVRPSQRRYRQLTLVLSGSLVAHLGIFYLIASQIVRPTAPIVGNVEAAIPIEIVPRFIAPSQPERRIEPKKPATTHHEHAAARPAPPPETVIAQPPITAEHEVVQLAEGRQPVALAPARAPALTDVEPYTSQSLPPGGYPINPGYWSVVEHWPFIDRTERFCVGPGAITRFMAAPCNHIYTCSYPDQTIEDGRLRFSGVISKRDERYDVRGEGTYTPTRLQLSVRGYGHWHALPFAFMASLDGSFLGDECPADAHWVGAK